MKAYKKIKERRNKNKYLKLYYTRTTTSELLEEDSEEQIHEPLYITGDKLKLLKRETCEFFLDTTYRFAVYKKEKGGNYLLDKYQHLYITEDNESGEVQGWLSIVTDTK